MKQAHSILLVALLAPGMSSFAQSDAIATDDDALEILKRVDAATKAVKGVAYEAEVWIEADGNRQAFNIKGRVRAQDNPGKETLKLHIKGDFVGRSKFHVITDGDDLVSISEKAKTAIRGKANDARRLLGLPMMLLMQEFLHPTPFSDELNAKSQKYEGRKEVAGVECNVVYVIYADVDARARWYFGRKDNLPRRVDRFTSESETARILLVKSLKVDPKLGKNVFDPKVPEGYRMQAYQAPKPSRTRPALLEVGSEAPDWTLPTADGKQVELKSLRGKVVILDFWATWCGPCKRAMPGIQKLHEHYKDKPVEFIGVNCWERGDAPAFMKEKKYTYGLLLEGDDVAKAYHVNGIPTFYVIGTDGKIVHRASGFNKDLEARLARIIDGALPKTAAGKKPAKKPAKKKAKRRRV
jgi:thiol-disulfide isomerase/thioredoxin/outer membrane lipoprotein-sorting protein